MKTGSNKNKLVLGASVIVGSIIALCFLILSQSISLPNFTSQQPVINEETGVDLNTTENEEEVPHFSLFNIINKFLPH